MKTQFYLVLHVVSMILLTATLFHAFANPDPKTRRKFHSRFGTLAGLMLVGGFGLLAVTKVGFPLWIIIKLICWLGLVVLGGLAYRKPQAIPMLSKIAVGLIIIAVWAVYFQPKF